MSPQVTVPPTQTADAELWASCEEVLGALSDFELQRGPARKDVTWGPAPVREMLRALGLLPYPLPVVQLVGSKGKGSTGRFLEALLTAAELRTGLYQSPHLSHRRERIRIHAQDSDATLWSAGLKVLWPIVEAMSEPPSRFEVETALAFWYFVESEVDVVIMEAGLGGTDDATSAVHPIAVGLTSVEREHTAVLGDHIAAITQAKIGSVRAGTPAFVGPLPSEAMRVVRAHCRTQQSAVYEAALAVEGIIAHKQGAQLDLVLGERRDRTVIPVELGCYGLHQPYMAALAVLLARFVFQELYQQSMPLSALDALSTLSLPGRLQALPTTPLCWLDSAHTPRSIQSSLEACQLHLDCLPHSVVFGVNADKELEMLLGLLLQHIPHLYLTTNPSPRAADPHELLEICETLPQFPHTSIVVVPDPKAAYKQMMREAPDAALCLVTGSFAIAGLIVEELASMTQS